MQSFVQNRKTSNLGPKMLYLCTFRLKFQKTIVFFKISTLEFVKMQIIVENKKVSNFRPDMPYLGIFRLVFLKNKA